jgi:hypothetical protein
MKLDRILYNSKKTIKLLNNFFYNDICNIIIYYISPKKFEKYEIEGYSKYQYIVPILGNYELCVNMPSTKSRQFIIGGIIGNNYEIFKLGLKKKEESGEFKNFNTSIALKNIYLISDAFELIITKDRDIKYILDIEKKISNKYVDYSKISETMLTVKKYSTLNIIKYKNKNKNFKKSLFLRYVDEYIIRKNRTRYVFNCNNCANT